MHLSIKFLIKVMIVSSVLSTFLSQLTFAEISDSVQNSPPSLLTDPLIQSTPELLKQGIWGSCSVTVEIDSTGSIDTCFILSSGNLLFNSLVESKVTSVRFSPALEDGHAVSSSVNFEITVPKDSLLSQCLQYPPVFCGTVVDTIGKFPLPDTRIIIYYTDTTEDSSITIGFSRYLSIIGNKEGMKYDGKTISTVTDSLGNFAYKLLPTGHITISVQSKGYEIGQFRAFIDKNKSLYRRLVLHALENQYQDNNYEVKVYGKEEFTPKKEIVEDEEKHIGISPHLSNIIQAKPEIRRVPEGPSKMLVRSGCPFDNVYVIAGIPMLAPFHFGGHPYVDIDGLMISALPDVKVTINDIAAKRVDVSGCIVETEPGRIKYDNHKNAEGFYLKGDYSILGIDFLASYSSRKKSGDFVQIGYTLANDYNLKWNNLLYRSVSQGNQGIGIPQFYGNATVAGVKSVGRLQYSAFGWFALDFYDAERTAYMEKELKPYNKVIRSSDRTIFPWGMGSIKIAIDSSERSFTFGGAHQFFGYGKQVISRTIAVRSYLDNIETVTRFDTIIQKPFVATLAARISYDKWNGFLIDNTIDSVYHSEGKEIGVHVNTLLIKDAGHFTYKLDLLGSAIHYFNKTQIIGDAGASITYEGENYQAGLHLGRITSRPDIRGIPDSNYRRHLNHTYVASIPLYFRIRNSTKFGIEPYLRYGTDEPQLDPVNMVWNPTQSSSVMAGGADISCRVKPLQWAEIMAAFNTAEGRRLRNTNNNHDYEWNLPWTIRSSLHLMSSSDLVHLYIDYIRTKGLPYYDIYSEEYEPLPVYSSMDLNLQIRMQTPRQRYINKLDCYFVLKNIFNFFGSNNVRDYYWDDNGIRRAVYLGSSRVDIGMRFGVKL